MAERRHGISVAAVAADRDLHWRQDGGQVRRALRHDADIRQHDQSAPVLLCAAAGVSGLLCVHQRCEMLQLFNMRASAA